MTVNLIYNRSMVVNYGVCYFYWVVSEWGVWSSLVLCWKGQQLIDVKKMRVALQNMCRFFNALSMIFWIFIKAMGTCRSHAEVCEIIPVNLQKIRCCLLFFKSVKFPLLNSCGQLLPCPIQKNNVIIFLWLKMPSSKKLAEKSI